MQLIISKQKIVIIYCGWWLLCIALQSFVLVKTFNFPWQVATVDATNFTLLLATAGYVIFTTLRFYQPKITNTFYIFVWSVCLAVLSVLVHNYLVTRYLFIEDSFYQQFTLDSTYVRVLFAWLMLELISIISWVWHHLQEEINSEKREQDALKLAREAELTSLRQQLQPHFLFNSLNSISALAGSKPEEARNMIQQLSEFLRGTIKRDDKQFVSLQDELSHLQLYLEIEKVRFGHRLTVDIKTDENSLLMKLPSLILQPVVENAIKFGLYDTTEGITIRIDAKAHSNYLVLTIENPFDPTTSQPQKGMGFGLSAVQRRLYLLYARNDLLTTRKEELGHAIFITNLSIPQ